MSASYAGKTFEVDISGENGFVPRWSQQATIIRRLLPYSNREDVQDAGRGNYRVTLRAWSNDDTVFPTLQASQGTTRRTLSNPFGDSVNYSNTMLVEVGPPRRRAWAADWEWEMTFEREGS